MNSQLLGKWKLCSCENVDDYMIKCNVSKPFRLMAKTLSYKLEFINEPDGQCKILMTAPLKSHTTVFRLNEEFEDKDMMGNVFRTTFYEQEGVLLAARRFPTCNSTHPAVENLFYINDNGQLVNTGTLFELDPPVTSYRYMDRVK